MIDALTALLTGGATGLLGTAVSAVTAFVQARQRHAQEVELRRLDMETARFEADSAARVAAVEAEGARAAAAWAAMEASHSAAARRWSRGDSHWLVAVDVVRGLMRPAITLGAVALVAAIYFTLGGSDVELLDIRPRIVDTVLYIATTCVLWWFGARVLDKRAQAQGAR